LPHFIAVSSTCAFLRAQEIDQHRGDADRAFRTVALGDVAQHRLAPDRQHDAPDGERACIEIECVEGKPEELRPTHPRREQGRNNRVRLAIVSHHIQHPLHLGGRE